jgi:chemotaxis protein CheD
MSDVTAAATGMPESGRKNVYLHPGQVHASVEPAAITTILGSCVTICLWDARLRIGGMNHYLLPDGVESGGRFRFGVAAIRGLIDGLTRHGSRRHDLQAKVFGGACVMEAFSNLTQHVGQRNVDLAKSMLENERIATAVWDVGGSRGRKIIFHTDDGTTLVRYL